MNTNWTKNDRTGKWSIRDPFWFDWNSKSCECNEGSTTIRSAEAYSDGAYLKEQCKKCGKTWCVYIEG